jgi:hypothetical protein
MRTARITIHHDRRHPSRLIPPAIPAGDARGATGGR